MRSAHDLETSNNIPAVPLNLRPSPSPSDSSKSYPLTRADGYAWLFTRRTGSEVMGPVARSCQLAPTADSLKAPTARPSSSQPFVIFALMSTL